LRIPEGVAIIHKSKERQYNGHKKKENKTTRSPQKNTVAISFASEGWTVLALLFSLDIRLYIVNEDRKGS